MRSKQITGPLSLEWILWSIPKELRMPSCQYVTFLPMVIETTGPWAPEAAQALSQISRAAGGGAGGPTLLQETCVLARSWRGRAALRRRAELVA